MTTTYAQHCLRRSGLPAFFRRPSTYGVAMGAAWLILFVAFYLGATK